MSRHSISRVFARPCHALPAGRGSLRALLPEGVECAVGDWEQRLRPKIEVRWLDLLGRPAISVDQYDPAPRLVAEMEGPDFCAASYLQPTGVGQSQKVIILHPSRPAGNPAPCAVVPSIIRSSRRAWLLPPQGRVAPEWGCFLGGGGAADRAASGAIGDGCCLCGAARG